MIMMVMMIMIVMMTGKISDCMSHIIILSYVHGIQMKMKGVRVGAVGRDGEGGGVGRMCFNSIAAEKYLCFSSLQ